MLDASAHMLLLLQQARIKNERPADASFLPLSLALACLLRQPPAGLAPPAGGLSLHLVDRLPLPLLERRLAATLLDEPLRAFTSVCALVKYVKVARELLRVCHEHMSGRKTTVEATQGVVQAVVDALPAAEEEEEVATELRPVKSVYTGDEMGAEVNTGEEIRKEAGIGEEKAATAVATDPAGVMRRAVGRDVGDGSAVLEIMKKFPTDGRIQSHGVRALKGVVRGATDAGEREKPATGSFSALISTSGDEESVDEEDRRGNSTKAEDKGRRVVQTVIDKMKQFPESLGLQRAGLVCLAEYASQEDEHVATITSSGGIASIIDAMVALPDDIPANMAALSVLAHPKIADESVVRVNPESRRLVLSALERFPLNEQIQGLGCLALANLSLRQDASMLEIVSKGGLAIVVESMKRFSATALVQAAGCWFIAIISGKNDEMKTACLEAGGLPACEKARLRFPDDPKVQQNAVQAIQTMLPGEVIEGEEAAQPENCLLQ